MKTRRKHMQQISKLGVAARRAKRAAELIPRTAFPLKGEPTTLEDWQLLGAAAAKAMWDGGIPHQIAKEIAGLVRASLAAFKVGALEKRMAEAEEIVATILERGSPAQQTRIRELEREVETLKATTRRTDDNVREATRPVSPGGGANPRGTPDGPGEDRAGAALLGRQGHRAGEPSALEAAVAATPVPPAQPPLKPASQRRPGDPGFPPTPQEYLDESIEQARNR